MTSALLTDLYELTMAAGYHAAGKSGERATFELFVRRLPHNRSFLVAAGLPQAVDYLLNLRFTPAEVDYLRGLPQFHNAAPEFFEYLEQLRFTGDLFAMPEGTPFFAGEPVLTVRAPLIEAQLVETVLLSTVGFQTMVASKAARIAEVAGPRSAVEFGTRRAHTPDAGTLAARAAYIGGCAGTSNTLAGMRYGIPVFGTSAHSWVLSFESEQEAFERLQQLLGPHTVYLLDTFDTVEGARRAARLGDPVFGVRLDSGNLLALSRAVRQVLDDAGLRHAKIMATGDLNEYKILELCAAGAPIDTFGVGTDLATSSDAPSLGAVYKLVELDTREGTRFKAKLSEEKSTMPGAKQVFRFPGHDLIGCHWECPSSDARALLQPVILNGDLVAPLPSAAEARAYASEQIRTLPLALRSLFPAEAEGMWDVEYSKALLALRDEVIGVPR